MIPLLRIATGATLKGKQNIYRYGSFHNWRIKQKRHRKLSKCMKHNSQLQSITTGILLALFFFIALYLRVGFIHNQVFVDGQVRFSDPDSYYHMRLVDNMSHHFPSRITFDPYTNYPHGSRVPWPPLFDWMIVSIAWVFGLGSLSQHMLEVTGAWLAPILASATVIPVYFIGKQLFNKWVGILSSSLIAVLPGEFLTYSVLGCCDHHAAEALFSTLTMLFLILSLKCAKQRQLGFSAFRQPCWASLGEPLLYPSIAGIFLGMYLLTWVGGLLLLFIFFVYFVAQSVIDYFRHEASDYLLIASLPMVLLGTAISAFWVTQLWTGRWFALALPIVVLTPIVLVVLSKFLARKNIRPIYYPFILLGLGLTGLAGLWVVNPSFFGSLSWAFSYVLPHRSSLDIWEMQPLLLPFGEFSLSYAWSRFTTAFFFGIVSIGILSYSIVRKASAEKTLLIVWSLLMLFAVLGQTRFSYYLAVNIALLTGYLSWRLLHFWGFRDTDAKISNVRKKTSRITTTSIKKTKGNSLQTMPRTFRIAAGPLIIISLIFVPNLWQVPVYANEPRFFPDNAWLESLSWLKQNTPDPFDDPDFYYKLYQPPARGQHYQYPESAYGVMSWWSYGHWITRIAHRIPISNPFQQGASQAANFFLAQNEAAAEAIVDRLGVKYIIIDENIATGFYGKASWAGVSEEDFYAVYYQRQKNILVPVLLFHPAYYRSLSVRLYNFDGKAVTPSNCTVISYKEKVYPDGALRKEITSTRTFTEYEDAEAYISQQKTEDFTIVSDNPFISPVPLEALKHYRLIYSSKAGKMQPGVGKVASVKIFEYVK